ncbi:hypothetical protein MAGR_24090 [Mycolicibacterium agri]|uniref:Uncharacterized protein n=1 Tax=Mycolicibacterium agri TaxID=36811 RepID=A0A7I9W0X7_MYCAG|nr:hypothetical protein MAGR_24090 [Mycolicibacterium agri]
MPIVALALFATFAVLGFGWRSWLQYRRTGSTGFRGISGRVGSVEWFADRHRRDGVRTGRHGRLVADRGRLDGDDNACPQRRFGLARNPIFTAMTVFGSRRSASSKPYLGATHGRAYRNYLASVGRFVPGVGRVSR